MNTINLWQRPRALWVLPLHPPWPGGQRGVVHCRPSYLSPLAWLGLQAAALWPHGVWVARRVQDGSDDPLGLVALAVLAWMLWRMALRLRLSPRVGWLAVAAALTAAANVALLALPSLLCALLAALALSAGVMAWLPSPQAAVAAVPRNSAATSAATSATAAASASATAMTTAATTAATTIATRPCVPRAPMVGLLVLALPLVSSLQYYGGYPLRVLTAQLSAWGLQAVGIAAERSGASMLVRGQLVIVDAPCSGVQMAWMAYFCACAWAALTSLRDGAFLKRLPFIGLLVLLGNVLRNSVLVALESRSQGLDMALHQAIGVAALAGVCAAVVLLMNGGRHARQRLV